MEIQAELIRPGIKRAQSSRLHAPHREVHSNHGEVVRDIIMAFADGLTVPFALTVGLSSCAVLLTFPFLSPT